MTPTTNKFVSLDDVMKIMNSYHDTNFGSAECEIQRLPTINPEGVLEERCS